MARTALIAAALLALTASPGQAQTTAPAIPNRVLMQLEAALFPTLRTRPVQNALHTVIAARNARYDACGNAAPCRIESALWTPEELAQAASGASHGDALTRELAGLNGIIHVYGQGQPPASPAIDGPDPKATLSNQDTISAALERVDLLKQQAPAADRGLLLALTLLDGADRLDAIRFGPLARTENAAAFALARRMNWARYRYTALIVPGIGPEDMVTPLSASGKANVDLAAARYRAGWPLHHPERSLGPSARHTARRGHRNAAGADRALWHSRQCPGDRSLCAAHHHQSAQCLAPADRDGGAGDAARADRDA
jgi:hypothetical protein